MSSYKHCVGHLPASRRMETMAPLYRCILLLISFMAIECKQFRFDYTYYPSIAGRLKLHNIPANSKDARLLCDMEGAVLVSPSNENLKNALDSELNKAEAEFRIHTGVNSVFSKGYFYSIEGVPLEDMPLQWLPGEPDNAGDSEDCIAYTKGSVADVKCTELLPFVCFQKGKETPKPLCDNIENQSADLSGGCYKLHQEWRTWSEAHRVCLATGGHLAIINSDQEASTIKQYLSKYIDISREINRIIYTGFYDWSGKGHWITIQGQSLEEAGYANFSQGYPYIPIQGAAGCGGIFANALLVSGECYETSLFLCEYK